MCIRNTLINIVNNNYKYTEKDIEDMHNNITAYFQKYFTINKKISELETIVKEINDEKIKTKYKNLKEMIDKETSFTDYEQYISDLESSINEYQQNEQKKIIFKQNKEIINNIYNNIIEKYNEIKKNYEIEIQLNDILRIFEKGYEEYQDLEFFNLFNEITFNNSINDKNILKELNKRLKFINSKIFVIKKEKQKEMNLGDDESFFLLDEIQKKMYRIDQYDISEKNINDNGYEKITNNYLSLEDLLDECIYIGEYKTNVFGEKIFVIYETDGYIIFKNKENEICINVNSPISLKNTGEKIIYPEYKDKKQMKEIIVSQINKKTEIYENNNIYYNNMQYNINPENHRHSR